MSQQLKIEAHVRDDKFQNSLEILVPQGMTHKELRNVNLGKLLEKFRPSGCAACLSGQHFVVRERFQKVLPVDIASFQAAEMAK